MIKILGEQSYRGFSAAMSEAGAQPVYVGRLAWPGEAVPLDSVIKLYEHATCGVANEAIGYVANAIRKVPQPKYGGLLLLSKEALPDFQYDVTPYIDEDSGLAVCWATSLEQNAKPFSYLRRLSSFTERQILAFYESSFSQTLVGVDHVTGNSDRHEGNFLYIDDMRYLAIDQGSVGGGAFWHTMWPDASAQNQIFDRTKATLSNASFSKWSAKAILEVEATYQVWESLPDTLRPILRNLLNDEQISIIFEYLATRSEPGHFKNKIGKLL